MDALPFYKWHWQDWRANRRVQRMPWKAKGPYRELLDEFWAEGSLPTEMSELADIVGCTVAELTELWVYIGPCWEERDGRLYNAKMDEQRTATDKARVAMANGGFKGGKASNSHTRANPKPTLALPKAMPDIEEETREEERRGEETNGTRKPPVCDASVYAKEVQVRTATGGHWSLMALTTVFEGKIRDGADIELVIEKMVESLERYNAAHKAGNLRTHSKPESFFADGLWRDDALWKWKAGKEPKKETQEAIDPHIAELLAYRGGK